MSGISTTQSRKSPAGAIALAVAAVMLAASSAWLNGRSGAADADAADHRLDEATHQLEQARRDVVRSSLDALVVRTGVFAGVLDQDDLSRSEADRSSTWADSRANAEAVIADHPRLAGEAEELLAAIDDTVMPAVPDLFHAAEVGEFEVLADPVGGPLDPLAFIDNAFTLVMYEAFIAEADRADHRTALLGPDDVDYLSAEIDFVALNPGYLGLDPDDPLAESWVVPDPGQLTESDIAWRNEVSELVAESSTWSTEQWTISWANGGTNSPPTPLDEVFAESEQNTTIVRRATDARLSAPAEAAVAAATDAESVAGRYRIGALITAVLAVLAVIGAASYVVRRLRQAGELATTDELTGVGNRRRLEKSKAALADQTLAHHAVIVIDLDRFKLVNDTHGHFVGDQVLVEVATQLQAFGRISSTKQHEVIRLGGDEFAVTLHHDERLDLESLEARLDAIQTFAVVTNSGDRVMLEFSYGIVDFVGATASLEDLMDAADLRAYENKQRRRDNRARVETAPPGEAVDLTIPAP